MKGLIENNDKQGAVRLQGQPQRQGPTLSSPLGMYQVLRESWDDWSSPKNWSRLYAKF